MQRAGDNPGAPGLIEPQVADDVRIVAGQAAEVVRSPATAASVRVQRGAAR